MAIRKKGKGKGKTDNKPAPIVRSTAKAAVVRGEGLVALVERKKVDIADAFYDIGLALRDLLRKKLYAALGFASFDQLLTARKLLSPSNSYQLIEIADRYTREQALSIGSPEKAYALARYAAATKESDPPATLLESGLPARGKGERVPVSELSARDIEAMTRAAKTKKGAHRTRRDDEADEAHARARALATKLGKRAGGKVAVEAKKRGKTWWAVVELTLDRLGTLAGE